jgi:hypothetical protein
MPAQPSSAKTNDQGKPSSSRTTQIPTITRTPAPGTDGKAPTTSAFGGDPLEVPQASLVPSRSGSGSNSGTSSGSRLALPSGSPAASSGLRSAALSSGSRSASGTHHGAGSRSAHPSGSASRPSGLTHGLSHGGSRSGLPYSTSHAGGSYATTSYGTSGASSTLQPIILSVAPVTPHAITPRDVHTSGRDSGGREYTEYEFHIKIRIYKD